MEMDYNSEAKPISDIDPSNFTHTNQDRLVASFLKSQKIAIGNALSRQSLFNIDGFLEKVEEKSE